MFWREKPMARKAGDQISVTGDMLEEIMNTGQGSMSFDDRLAVLARLRESGMESGGSIDRVMMERLARLGDALSAVEQEHGKLRELIGNLTEPPYFPAVFLAPADTLEVQGALVQTDNERRIVRLGEGIALEELTPGDEVFLSSERNFLLGQSGVQI